MFVISSSKRKVLDPLSRKNRNNQQFTGGAASENCAENEEESSARELQDRGNNVENRKNEAELEEKSQALLFGSHRTEFKKSDEKDDPSEAAVSITVRPAAAAVGTTSLFLRSENQQELANVFVGENRLSPSNSPTKNRTKTNPAEDDGAVSCLQTLLDTVVAYYRETLLVLVLLLVTSLIVFGLYRNFSAVPPANSNVINSQCIKCLTTNETIGNNFSFGYALPGVTSSASTGILKAKQLLPLRLFNKTDGRCVPFHKNLPFSLNEIVVFPDFCVLPQCAALQTVPGIKPIPFWLAVVLVILSVLFNSLLQVLKYFILLPMWDSSFAISVRKLCYYGCCCCLCYCFWRSGDDRSKKAEEGVFDSLIRSQAEEETCREVVFPCCCRLGEDKKSRTDRSDIVRKAKLALEFQEHHQRTVKATIPSLDSAKKKETENNIHNRDDEHSSVEGEFDNFNTQEARSLAVVFRCFGTIDARLYILLYLFAIAHFAFILFQVGNGSSSIMMTSNKSSTPTTITDYQYRYFVPTLNTRFFYPKLMLARDKLILDEAQYYSTRNVASAPAFNNPRRYSSPFAIVSGDSGEEVNPFPEEGQVTASPVEDGTSPWFLYHTSYLLWLNSGTVLFVGIYYSNWLCYWYAYALAKTSCGADSDSDDDADEHRNAKGLKRFKSKKQIKAARLKRQKLIETQITYNEEVQLKGDYSDSFANRILFPLRGLEIFFPSLVESHFNVSKNQNNNKNNVPSFHKQDAATIEQELLAASDAQAEEDLSSQQEKTMRQKNIHEVLYSKTKLIDWIALRFYRIARVLHMIVLLLPLLPIILTHVVPASGIYVPISLLIGLITVASCFVWLAVVKWFEEANAKRLALIVAMTVARVIGGMIVVSLFQTMATYATLFYSGGRKLAWQEIIAFEYNSRNSECFVNGLWYGVTSITRLGLLGFVV